MSIQSWPVSLMWRTALLMIATLILVACGDSEVGADRKAILGEWVLDSDQPLNPIASLSQTRISYNDDGTSTYQARLNIAEPDSPVSTMAIQADVLWTLEETVLTRELQSVTVIPVNGDGTAPTEEQTAFARAYQDGFADSPPARFIVEVVNQAQLVLLDPVTGDILVFNRVPEMALRN